jgi:hypothetical protein
MIFSYLDFDFKKFFFLYRNDTKKEIYWKKQLYKKRVRLRKIKRKGREKEKDLEIEYVEKRKNKIFIRYLEIKNSSKAQAHCNKS